MASVVRWAAMAVLADIKEVADLSEAKADAHLGEGLSKLRQHVLLAYDQGLELEADAIALFKLAVLQTRKTDDVATIAATWQAVAEAYARMVDKLKKVTQEALPGYEALEVMVALPPQVTH